MGIKFANNASSNITHALTVDAISVSITPGTGDLFPYIVEGTDYFYATLAGNSGLEIVKVTNRILDTMTIERAQDGTSALLFNAGDLFELRIVAADFEDTFAKVDSMLEEAIEESTSIVNSALANKAPVSHASTSTTYGVSTGDEYGHVKLSDNASEQYGVLAGIAATPLAVKRAQETAVSEAVAEAVGEATQDASSKVSNLNVSLRTLINEKVSTLNTAIEGKAPTRHDSASTTYGVGTGGLYGHVKLSDYADLAHGVAQGIAATPRALRTTVPAGTVIAFAGNPSSSPLGYLLCAGAAVSRTTYSDLFSAIGTTYGAGDGSTTFNLPNLTDARYIQGSSTAGNILDAGIPNITGAFSLDINAGEFYTHPATGAFSYESAGDQGAQGDGGPSSRISFDASKSSANAGNVYGKCNTIRPASLTMRYYIKY